MFAHHMLKAVALIIAASTPLAVSAQTYPAKAVRIIVPFAPGSGVDIAIRLITQKLNEAFGQQFVSDNRPGAGGNIGAELAARAPADGYTLFAAGAPAAISQTLYPKLGYDLLKDFDAVALVASVPLILVVHPSLPAKSVRELAALAKAKRGELTYASTGNGSTPHLTAEMLKMQTGIEIVHVAYKGTPTAVTDLVSGNVTFMFANSLSVLPHVQSGRLRALAISSAKRSPLSANLPAVTETYPGFESGTWYSFAAPAGTPRDIIARLNGAIVKALQLPDVRDKFQAQGAVLLSGTPQEAGAFFRSEVAKWGKVVKASGAKVD
jgi:tripartite-type tricarboxylate transporter receptor subunit TctC